MLIRSLLLRATKNLPQSVQKNLAAPGLLRATSSPCPCAPRAGHPPERPSKAKAEETAGSVWDKTCLHRADLAKYKSDMKVLHGRLSRTQLAQTRKNRYLMPKREFALKHEVSRILQHVNKSPVSPEICRKTWEILIGSFVRVQNKTFEEGKELRGALSRT